MKFIAVTTGVRERQCAGRRIFGQAGEIGGRIRRRTDPVVREVPRSGSQTGSRRQISCGKTGRLRPKTGRDSDVPVPVTAARLLRGLFARLFSLRFLGDGLRGLLRRGFLHRFLRALFSARLFWPPFSRGLLRCGFLRRGFLGDSLLSQPFWQPLSSLPLSSQAFFTGAFLAGAFWRRLSSRRARRGLFRRSFFRGFGGLRSGGASAVAQAQVARWHSASATMITTGCFSSDSSSSSSSSSSS